jgi:hypothetical protein
VTAVRTELWRRHTAPALPAPPREVKFEISPAAAVTIRERGGQLWIWPSPATRTAYATTEPPGEEHEWTTHRRAGFVVNADDAIVPPERWEVELPPAASRHLLARWIGTDPHEASGRIPLVPEPTEPVTRGAWVMRGLALLVVAWLLGSLALELAGVHRWWFAGNPVVEAFHLLTPLAAAGAWLWQRLRRVDEAAPTSSRPS